MEPRARVAVAEGPKVRSGALRAERREANARREAFAELHRDHASGVYNLALRLLGNREDAQDVSQEVLLKAYERLGKPGELNQRAWLYRVTVNACYDHLRAVKRKPAVAWEPRHELALPTKIDHSEQDELRRQVEEAFRLVPPAQRAALLLREIHGLHVSEVAYALGVKPASAEVTLVRARSSFRRHFTEIAEPGVRWVASGTGEKRHALASAPRMGNVAMVVGLPALFLNAVPLPACLDASSLLAVAGPSVGIGGGVVAGVVAKIAAAMSTKAAVVAIGATVVAGSAGGLYTVEHAVQVERHPPSQETTAVRVVPQVSPAAVVRHGEAAVASTQTPQDGASSTPVPASAGGSAASGSPSATPSPSPLVAGESGGGSPSATPSPSPTPTDTPPSASPSPSSTPTASPSATPSPDPSPSSSPTL